LHWLRLGHTPKGEEGLVVIDLLQVAKIKKPRTLLQPYVSATRLAGSDRFAQFVSERLPNCLGTGL
jgi:hypothetical protein